MLYAGTNPFACPNEMIVPARRVALQSVGNMRLGNKWAKRFRKVVAAIN
jgi:hypothetical protein